MLSTNSAKQTKILHIIYFILLLAPSIYFGAVTFTVSQFHKDLRDLTQMEDSLQNIKLDTIHAYNGVLCENAYELQIVELNRRLDDRFPSYGDLSEKESLIFLSICWGTFGGLIRLLINRLYEKRNRRSHSFFLIPVLAGLSGILTYCLMYYSPGLLGKELPTRFMEPEYFAYAGLIGGIFTSSMYKKLDPYAEKK